jgi:hypothetical protein
VPQGRKRTFEERIETDYAKHGVTKGVMTIEAEDKTFCGIICKGWPTWAFGATLRGWTVVTIITKDTTWKKLSRRLFPNAVVMDGTQGTKASLQFTKIDYWFSDIDPPRCLSLWESNTSYIVTARRVRHIPDSLWTMEPIVISHCALGGVTDGEWTCYIYSKASSPPRNKIGCCASMDLGGILDTMLDGRPCAVPSVTVIDPPRVVEIRPNMYHGQGILPWSARNAFVIAPCIFSPTNWVKRRISQGEMLRVLDIPAGLERDLSATEVASLIHDTSFIPLKIVCKILDSFPNTRSLAGDKRVRLGGEEAIDKSCPHQQGSPQCQSIDEVSIDLTSNTLQDADRLSRNTKATKNDDAMVPEYLWDEAIVKDGDPRKLIALTHLRTFALRWWKRHTTEEFLKWLTLRSQDKMLNPTELIKDKLAGLDCVQRCSNSSWWEWTAGSRPLFWRWPEDYRLTIRDGVTPWIKGPLPRYLVPQRFEKDLHTREAIIAKLKELN